MTSLPARLAGWVGRSAMDLLETLIPADHEQCVSCDRVTPKHVQPCTRCYLAQCQLTAAEESSEDTPYCTGCGRPHGDGECLRDKASEQADVPSCGVVAPDRDSLLPYRCSLPQGHSGNHVAWAGKLPIAEWVDGSRFVFEPSAPNASASVAVSADVSPAIPPAGGWQEEGLSHSPRDPSGAPNVTAEDLVLAASIVYGYAILPHVSSGKAVEYTALADRLNAAATP